MNADIIIIRNAISKVTQILANRDIEVTQRGDQAFVHYHPKTGEALRVNIPYLPDKASDLLIAATQGFLDHEVAHLLFTDSAAIIKGTERGKKFANLHNIVEDCFIEHRMMARFKGSAHNLGRVRHLVFNERVRDAAIKMKAMNAPESEWWKSFAVTILRALADHEECAAFLDEHDIWSHVPSVLKRIDFFAREIQECETTWDTLALTEKVFDALSEQEEGEAGDSEETDNDDQSESQECSDPESGDQKTKDKKEPSDGQSEGKTQDESEDGTESETSKEKSEQQDEKEGQGDDEAGEEDSSEDDTSNQDDKSGDSDDGAGEQDQDEDSSNDDRDQDSGGDADGDGTESGSSDEQEISGEDFTHSLEHVDDFSELVSQRVKDFYLEQATNGSFGPWLIFSDEHNTPKPLQIKHGVNAGHMVSKMSDAVDGMVGPMAKTLERLILAKKRSVYDPGRRSGRLHTANLHRLMSGDDRVFRRKRDHRLKDTAVQILVDQSGSMGGQKITTAAYSAYAIAQMLQRCNIPVDVMSFTTSPTLPHGYGEEMKAAEKRIGRSFSHQGTNTHLIIKGFGERLGVEVKERFAALAEGITTTAMWSNCDPESVEAAAKNLARRPEERRILMVLSDGFPAFAGDMSTGEKRLCDVVGWCEAAGMEVIGIGIESDAVQHYYPKHLVLQSVAQLPGAIMGQMKKALLG